MAWVVSDGTPGMENQCVGLAEAVGLPFTTKRVSASWRRLLPGLRLGDDGFRPPWPRLLIASGRQSVAPALAIGRASRGATFTVQIQDPRVALDRFDLVVAPEHDQLAGPNVVATLGSLHGVTPARLAAARAAFVPVVAALPRPRIAVLVGGANRAYRFRVEDARALGGDLAALARTLGGGLMVTPSRRTGAAQAEALGRAVADVPGIVWLGDEPNPYLGFLALADAVVVTADSVNMTTEALATGQPVHVAVLPGGSDKFRRFHAALVERGLTRPFGGRLESWSYEPLDETGRVAALVRDRLGLDPAGIASRSHAL